MVDMKEIEWVLYRMANIDKPKLISFDYESNYGAIPRKVLEELNGWWEFFDDGLGFDNTEIALRAMMNGSRIILLLAVTLTEVTIGIGGFIDVSGAPVHTIDTLSSFTGQG